MSRPDNDEFEPLTDDIFSEDLSDEEFLEEVFSSSNKEEKGGKNSASKKSARAQVKPVSEEDERIERNDTEQWYVVHCYSGYENKVCHNLEQRIDTMGMKGTIIDVVVPTQEEVEVRDGKRKAFKRNIFPGYVLVKMKLNEESWFIVRNTPGVTGFIGMGKQPTPLRKEEEIAIFKRMEAEAPRVNVSFREGEKVRIVDGPFNDFRGTVAAIDADHSKLRVMVNFFGRETPVELDFLQVEKS